MNKNICKLIEGIDILNKMTYTVLIFETEFVLRSTIIQKTMFASSYIHKLR